MCRRHQVIVVVIRKATQTTLGPGATPTPLLRPGGRTHGCFRKLMRWYGSPERNLRKFEGGPTVRSVTESMQHTRPFEVEKIPPALSSGHLRSARRRLTWGEGIVLDLA